MTLLPSPVPLLCVFWLCQLECHVRDSLGIQSGNNYDPAGVREFERTVSFGGTTWSVNYPISYTHIARRML